MKRIFSFVLILGLLACFFVPAQAAGEDYLTVSGPKACKPGSTITLAFGIKEGANLCAFEFCVSYDTNAFQFVSYENGELAAGAMCAGNNVNEEVRFVGATLTPINQAGSLFTVTFAAGANAKGDYNFVYNSTLFSDEDGKDYTVNEVTYTISVTENAAELPAENQGQSSGEEEPPILENGIVNQEEEVSSNDSSAQQEETLPETGNSSPETISKPAEEEATAQEQPSTAKEIPWWMIGAIIGGLVLVVAGGVGVLLFLSGRQEKKSRLLQEEKETSLPENNENE